MKKAMIAIVASIYVVSIIIVAFLGVRAEVLASLIDVNVERIVLDELSDEDKLVGGEYTYYNDAVQSISSRVYSSYSRPNEEEIDPETGKQGTLSWNIYEEGEEEPDKFNYIIKVWNLNTIFDDPSWRDGSGKFKINAHVLPKEATKQKITYSIIGNNEITIDENGVISLEKFDNISIFEVIMSATDSSQVFSKISFTVQKYK